VLNRLVRHRCRRGAVRCLRAGERVRCPGCGQDVRILPSGREAAEILTVWVFIVAVAAVFDTPRSWVLVAALIAGLALEMRHLPEHVHREAP
jgi:hypothetical protein